MNREIKFRAWDGETMFYGVQDAYDYQGFPISSKEGHIAFDHFGAVIESANAVMQFTGLHDKEEEELYESDVVIRNGTHNYIVDLDNMGWLAMYYDDPEKDYERIGNIHENPELIQ